jgi:CheY-like chemotaxis protein
MLINDVMMPGPEKDILAIVVDITARKQAEEDPEAHESLEQRVQERRESCPTRSRSSRSRPRSSEPASELTLVEQRSGPVGDADSDAPAAAPGGARLRAAMVGDGDAAVRKSARTSAASSDALADARSLTAELSPPMLRTGGLRAGLTGWPAGAREAPPHGPREAPPAPPPPLPEDLTVLLFQAVRELLFNAVKYAQVFEATVTLAWDARGLTLTVADTGVGFDPTGLRGEGGGGGGFGLARIRHRLELLGGCMTIVSASGQGTRVTLAVRLSLADQPPAPLSLAQAQPAPAPTQLPPTPGRARPLRVLVVDDHQVVRQALAQLLRAEADLTVVGEAGTGTAAVALAHLLMPDVVLMDINMPEMNGIEATRAIHAAFPAMRVIGLSMYDRGDQQVAMKEAGAVAYVSKSAPADVLVAAIGGGHREAPSWNGDDGRQCRLVAQFDTLFPLGADSMR